MAHQQAETTAHTPGPWTYEVEKVSGPHLTQTFIFAHGDVIGRAYADSKRDNSQANASLIAAAPDLLAACEAICNETFDAAVNGRGETNITPEAVERIYEAARIAIAKARGAA